MRATCPTCGVQATGLTSETKSLEVYLDGVGEPNDPRRIPAKGYRQLVPGPAKVTVEPCGHVFGEGEVTVWPDEVP